MNRQPLPLAKAMHTHSHGPPPDRKRRLRSGFSTGTAATAAALAALRHLLTGTPASTVAVRLPAGYFLPVDVNGSRVEGAVAEASVIKDGGDDPDVTHGAEICAAVRCIKPFAPAPSPLNLAGIRLAAGAGVGVVTKPGLPVRVGEPAINPVPREMLLLNLTEELLRHGLTPLEACREQSAMPQSPGILLPFDDGDPRLAQLLLDVEVRVPRGVELARHTLNPRLGIVGGISILGTTGIVRPLSHEAYEDTIRAALSVAASNGCTEVVLSTGGKSERYARDILPHLPGEAFIQIADFFEFSVRASTHMGFRNIVHSTFFGKVVKMAQGHAYTHAHRVEMDLAPLVRLAAGYGEGFCREIAQSNTARHALELLLARGATSIIQGVAREALEQSRRLTKADVRLLLFDYNGTLLADCRG